MNELLKEMNPYITACYNTTSGSKISNGGGKALKIA